MPAMPAMPGRCRRATSGILLAALALGGTLVGAPGTGSVRITEAAGVQTITLEPVSTAQAPTVLGGLASRSQQKPVTIAGIGPYTISGTDSTTSNPYAFVTDFNYNPSTLAWRNESDERTVTSFITSSSTNASNLGRTGVTMLKSNGQCISGNTRNGRDSYCSAFGPQVYSAAFVATVGQSVSFQWSAKRISDDYESYAFLVKVDETSPGVFGYGTPASHQILTYGRGNTQQWQTASGEIPSNGSYRFRFVNGTYDGTGGLAIGSEMYIDSIVRLGTSNPITFAQPVDRVIGSGAVTLSATVPSGGPAVNFASLNNSVCTVAGNQVTLVSNGVCSITANHPGDGNYVASPTETRSFRILAGATAPTNFGVPLIQGGTTGGAIVSATGGTWGDGGSAVTNISSEWLSNGAAITGVTGNSCQLVAASGSTLTRRVTQTNSVGSTAATSAGRTGFTCAAVIAPSWTDEQIGGFRVGESFADAVTASGTPAATYSVSAGTLPVGVVLATATGALSGTPTAAGAYNFTIQATNGVGSPITTNHTGNVATAATIPVFPVSATLPPMTAGTPFTGGFTASGDPAPTYSVSAGALPAGLTLNPTTGAITGTPTSSGPYSFTVSATNSAGTDAKAFTGTIAAGTPPTPTTPPTLTVQLPKTSADAPIVISGGGFVPGTRVDVVVNGLVVQTVTVGSDGRISVNVQAPTDLDDYTIKIRPTGDTSTDLVSRRMITDFGRNAVVVPEDAGYVPLTPSRVLDTRDSTARLDAGDTFRLGVGSDWNVSDTVTALALNVTATRAADNGYLTVYPCGVDRPVASVVNYVPNSSTPNLTLAAPGENDEICVYTSEAVDLVIDLNGYFAEGVESRLVPQAPVRLMDTRGGVELDAGKVREVQVTGAGFAPESATAAVLNVVAVGPDDGGFLTLFPCGETVPIASNVNYTAGSASANHAFVKLSATGTVCVFSYSATDIVIDLNASFTTEGDVRLVPTIPVRVLDTRDGLKLAAGSTIELDLGGAEGVLGAPAFALNVTATQPEASGYMTVFPCADGKPLTSSLNTDSGRTIANHATAMADADGKVCLFTFVATHLIVDVEGIYL